MHIVGLRGHPRRIANPYVYEFLDKAGIHFMNEFMTVSALLLGATQLLLVYNFVTSLAFGRRATPNPWHANTLEWSTTSPASALQLRADSDVYHAAYEYSLPGADEDYLPQTQPLPPLSKATVLEPANRDPPGPPTAARSTFSIVERSLPPFRFF